MISFKLKLLILTLITHILGFISFFYQYSLIEFIYFIFWFLFSSFGVTVGLHRFFTHKSFKATRFFKIVLAIMSISALRGPIDLWCGMHRSHHANSDRTDLKQDLDPYNAGIGFFNSYIGWLFKISNIEIFAENFRKLANDITNDHDLKIFNKINIDLVFNILLIIISVMIFDYKIIFLIFGLRLVLVHQAIFLINSIGHGHGSKFLNYRNFNSNDRSSNNISLFLLSFGEGWHNNHHAYPNSANNQFKWFEFDPSYYFILFFSLFKQTYDIKNFKIKDIYEKN